MAQTCKKSPFLVCPRCLTDTVIWTEKFWAIDVADKTRDPRPQTAGESRGAEQGSRLGTGTLVRRNSPIKPTARVRARSRVVPCRTERDVADRDVAGCCTNERYDLFFSQGPAMFTGHVKSLRHCQYFRLSGCKHRDIV